MRKPRAHPTGTGASNGADEEPARSLRPSQHLAQTVILGLVPRIRISARTSDNRSKHDLTSSSVALDPRHKAEMTRGASRKTT